jgi:hypothetical protein
VHGTQHTKTSFNFHFKKSIYNHLMLQKIYIKILPLQKLSEKVFCSVNRYLETVLPRAHHLATPNSKLQLLDPKVEKAIMVWRLVFPNSISNFWMEPRKITRLDYYTIWEYFICEKDYLGRPFRNL